MTDAREVLRSPLTGPAAWRGPQLSEADWLCELDEAEVDALGLLRSDLVDRGVGLADIDPDTTPIPGLDGRVADVLDRLENGIGFVVVHGLDIGGWSEREAGLVFYALGRQMGVPVKQNAQGHLVGHIRDTGRDIFTDSNVHGYQVRIGLPFHTDTSTDLLALLCLQQAMKGGTSGLAPLQTIYNEVLADRPDLIDAYYEPYSFDCREEEHPGGGPFYTRVLASVGEDGRFSLRHNSGYARSAARFEASEPMTEPKDELLSLVDTLAGDPAIHLRVKLECGDMIFVNNYAVAHSRSAFEDFDDEALKRHLLRLWLVRYDGRSLAADFDNRAGLATTADIREDGLAPA